MVATPSPLPLPDAAPLNSFADAINAAASGVPGVDPEVATSIAKAAPNPPQALQNTQAAQGLVNALNLKNYLKGLNSTDQAQTWTQYSQTQQSMLRSVGYQPPHPGRSLFGTITHDVGQGFHDVLNAAWAPYRAATHAARTGFAVANQNPNDPLSGSITDILHALKTPSDWARAWQETSNGEHYIIPQVKAAVAKKYDPTTYAAALALAQGKSVSDILSTTPAAQQQAVAERLLDPKTQAAVDELKSGHMSVGRGLARTLGLNPGPGNSARTLGAVVSGLGDAAFMWQADPTNVGLKALSTGATALHFVQTGEHVQAVYDTSSSVQRAFADITEHLKAIDNAAVVSKLQRAGGDLQTVIDTLPPADSGALSDLIDRYPSLERSLDDTTDPISGLTVPGLLRANIQTPQDLVDWMANSVNLQNIIAGRPARLAGDIEGGTLPYLSRAGQARLAAKGVLQRSIDYLADTPARIHGVTGADIIDSPLNPTGPINRIETASGNFMRHLLTLTPQESFNIYDRGWFSKLRNVALMSLPRANADHFLTEYAAAATTGERVQVLRGLVRSVLDSAGVDNLPEVSSWMDDATDVHNPLSPISNQNYSALGKDFLPDNNGNLSPAAILREQTRDEFTMPTYKTLYAQVKKLGIIRATNGALNNRMVDTFMNSIWKPLSLARFGFSLRVAGEEAFGLLLRNGPLHAVRARFAASAVAHLDHGSEDSPLARVWDTYTSHLPTAVQKTITNPIDLIAHYLADGTSRAMTGVEGKLAGDRYLRAVRLAAKHHVLGPDGAFAELVSSGERNGGSVFDDTISTGRPRTKIWVNGRPVNARLQATGRYAGYKSTMTVFTNHYYKRLREIATDSWARPALVNSDLPLEQRIEQVAQRLKSDKNWIDNRRAFMQRDGSTIDSGATVDSLARDHAAVIVDHVDYHLRSPNNTEISLGDHTLRQHLIDHRRPPTTAVLDSLPTELRPAAVSGPETVPVLGGGSAAWTKSINAMFHVIGKQIDWISRTPMFIDNLARGLDAFESSGHLAAWTQALGADNAEKVWVDAAVDRALKDTIPYIHHPELRSQMSIITRNVAPFWFAQEQFLKRWARTFVYSPAAFREAQLISTGVAHSGFTHTDPSTGQQYFVYPGAGAVQDVLAKTLGHFNYFAGAYLPIEANLRGQVKMVTPGLERLGLPSLGPAVIIPLHAITSQFPELQHPAQTLEGPISSQTGILTAFFPTTVSRLWNTFTANEHNNAQYASAMMQAIQYLEASGHGLGEVAVNNLGKINTSDKAPDLHGPQYKPGDYVTDATGKMWIVQADGAWRENSPQALNTYMNRVRNWTRIFLLTRTIFGFNVPASPSNLFDPNHVNEDLQTLLKTLPTNEAFAAFMKLHPNATAYTVFQSKDQAGAPLPATASAMAFMDANPTFFHDHPLAGSFFIPTTDSTGKYSNAAYQSQLEQQLRIKKTPEEFWQDIAYSAAATRYFAAENNKNAMLNANYGQRNQIDAAWTAQSQQFQKANPLFAAQLAQTPGQYTRANIESDLGAALNDPNLPESPQTEHIRTLYNAYLNYQRIVAPYSLPNAGTISGTQKYNIELAFIAQAEAYVAAHPDTLNVYNRLIRPDFSAILSSQAASQ